MLAPGSSVFPFGTKYSGPTVTYVLPSPPFAVEVLLALAAFTKYIEVLLLGA